MTEASVETSGAVATVTAIGSGLRDLWALADAVGSGLGGTVIITDARLHLIAYRVDERCVHEDVWSWVVRRRAPQTIRRQLSGDLAGQWADLWAARDVVRLGGAGDGGWTVAPIRGADGVVGGVWSIGPYAARPDRPMTDVLVKAAGLAVERLCAVEGRESLRSRATRVLAKLLAGNDVTDEAVRLLPLGPESRLLAFDGGGHELSERLWLALGPSPGPGAAACVVDGRAYALATDAGQVESITRLVREASEPSLHCAVGEPTDSLASLAGIRAALDRLLCVADVDRPVVRLAENHSWLVIAEIAELASELSGLAGGPVQTLAEMDATRGTSYLLTLEAYFATGRDLQQAARRLHVHRNTLRYRIDRIHQLTGLDLSDPVAELVTDLQLRVRRARSRARATTDAIAT